MKHLKLFKEMKINWREFPVNGHNLSVKERKILIDLVGDFLNLYNIRVDDHSYYTGIGWYFNRFDDFNELKKYLLLCYYMDYDKPEEYIELLKTSEFDPSVDDNYSIKWASDHGHVELVKILLNDERVISKLTEKEIKEYTNEIS